MPAQELWQRGRFTEKVGRRGYLHHYDILLFWLFAVATNQSDQCGNRDGNPAEDSPCHLLHLSDCGRRPSPQPKTHACVSLFCTVLRMDFDAPIACPQVPSKQTLKTPPNAHTQFGVDNGVAGNVRPGKLAEEPQAVTPWWQKDSRHLGTRFSSEEVPLIGANDLSTSK